MLQDTQVYSRLFYESKLKQLIDQEFEDRSPTKEERFAMALKVTKREWENESEEVRAIVKAKKEELQLERSEADLIPTSEDKQVQAINNLGSVVSAFLQHLKQTTGWTGFLVIGGPKPDHGGNLTIAS